MNQIVNLILELRNRIMVLNEVLLRNDITDAETLDELEKVLQQVEELETFLIQYRMLEAS